jgi:hypothetical protein
MTTYIRIEFWDRHMEQEVPLPRTLAFVPRVGEAVEWVEDGERHRRWVKSVSHDFGTPPSEVQLVTVNLVNAGSL